MSSMGEQYAAFQMTGADPSDEDGNDPAVMAPLTELALSLVAKHGVDRYSTLELNCLKLLEEAGELARCILRGEDPSAEMADVEICLRMLAYKAGVSIEDAVADKVSTDTRTFVVQ